MSWSQVFNLLVQYGSREAIPAAELETALAVEPGGDREVQIRIAEAEYRRANETVKRKEADDGRIQRSQRNRWHFG